MTTTVRSVRVELEMGIASYIANAATVGRVTENMADRIKKSAIQANIGVRGLDSSLDDLGKKSAEAKISQSGLGAEVGKTEESVKRSTRSTKAYTLEMAIADEKASRLRKSLRDQARATLDARSGIDRLVASTRDGGADIDKFSGRLRVLTDLALVGGPALLRLGAGALPAITAGVAGLGAGAGAIGVTIAALHGVTDGLKALNDYELERTPENLQALRLEFEKLGPEGAHFVMFLRDLGPELDSLQQLSRAGVLPGFEDGIDSLITRLPIVEQIVNRLSQEVGDLASEAGDALAGDDWTPFFEYVRSTAAPTLDAFAHSAGNVALGLANILVAFDPLTRDFTSGLEDMTGDFAEWSKHLEDDEGFQSFLDTVQEAGPELREFLGSAIDLMVGLVRASAPLAETTVPILTGILDVLAGIANSDVGPAIYTAAAAWTLYSRAASLADKATTGISSSWNEMSKGGKAVRVAAGIGLIAAALSDYDDKAGISTTTTLGLTAALAGGGPWGIAAAATVGAIIDITKANDDLVASTEAAQDALDSGDTSEMVRQLEELRGEIQETADDATISSIGDVWRVTTTAGVLLGGGVDKLGAAWSRFRGEEDDAKAAASDLEGAIASSHSVLDGLRPVLGGITDELAHGAANARAFSGALAELNGWFDKRDALRGYRDALAGVTEGLKDGFSRDDAANIDAVGRSILQVAQLIESPKKRADFLAGARAQLEDLATHSGPKAAAAVQEVIDKFDSSGLTNPPPIKLTANQKAAEAAFASVRRDLHQLDNEKAESKVDADDSGAQRAIRRTNLSLDVVDRRTAKPAVDVDPGNSFSILGAIQARLAAIKSKSITVTVNQRGGVTSGFGGHSVTPAGADGMTVPGQRQPYGDKVLAYLAPGEEVISNRHGQADRFRSDRASGRIPGYADGGTTGTYVKRSQGFNVGGGALFDLGGAADGATRGLKGLEKAADKVQASYEKEKSKLDDLISQRSSVASSIASAAVHDPFGNGLAGLDAQLEADTADIEAMSQALATLVQNGLDPKSALYQQLAASMDVNTAQQLAQLSAGELAQRAQRFQNRSDEAGALGGTVAGQQFNEAIRDQTRATRKLDHRLEGLQHAIQDLKDLPKHVKDGAYQGSWEGSAQGTWEGTKDGQDGRNRRTATFRRTGGPR